MSKFFTRLCRMASLVGRDLEGNLFYEFRVTGDDARRTRRTVEYVSSSDMWDSASGIARLPAQWTSWLSHTRHDPPTLDELLRDKERQENLASRIALLNKREEPHEDYQSITMPAGTADVFPESRDSLPAPPKPNPIGPSPEPQSWNPRLIRRG